jgi:hypothetical protein
VDADGNVTADCYADGDALANCYADAIINHVTDLRRHAHVDAALGGRPAYGNVDAGADTGVCAGAQLCFPRQP